MERAMDHQEHVMGPADHVLVPVDEAGTYAGGDPSPGAPPEHRQRGRGYSWRQDARGSGGG
jgi:hypothetical protein